MKRIRERIESRQKLEGIERNREKRKTICKNSVKSKRNGNKGKKHKRILDVTGNKMETMGKIMEWKE